MAGPPAKARLPGHPSILQWNVNSLQGRGDNFYKHLEWADFDVLALHSPVYMDATEAG